MPPIFFTPNQALSISGNRILTADGNEAQIRVRAASQLQTHIHIIGRCLLHSFCQPCEAMQLGARHADTKRAAVAGLQLVWLRHRRR